MHDAAEEQDGGEGLGAVERAAAAAQRAEDGRPKPTKMMANSAAMPSAIASACAAAASAAALLPEPRARATEEEMPPPMAPADIMPSVICAGNTPSAGRGLWGQSRRPSTRRCADPLLCSRTR